MFLKRERPETDDFAIQKYLAVKEKYFLQVLADILTNISEHSKHFI